jgi:ABC-type sugar transport system ATPase subunit
MLLVYINKKLLFFVENNMNILEVKNISKTFGLESVLKDVSLIVKKIRLAY